MVTSPQRGRIVLFLCLLAGLGDGTTTLSDVVTKRATEYEMKAAYLYYFATFVTWPSETLSNASTGQQDLVIGILGDDPFGALLEETIRGKKVNDHRLIVRRFESVTEARESNILYISSSEKDDLSHILSTLEGAAVLTVGEMEGFASRGGQIGFLTEERKVRFEINVGAVKRAGLKVSAQLMKLARIVHNG
ncbi:MAG TPA: YfiR family protein [Candidatus Polarisedimenticolia bacterium]|nr:YfiR family protein [Candidatus Polarisedimenticolia bacterium]